MDMVSLSKEEVVFLLPFSMLQYLNLQQLLKMTLREILACFYELHKTQCEASGIRP